MSYLRRVSSESQSEQNWPEPSTAGKIYDVMETFWNSKDPPGMGEGWKSKVDASKYKKLVCSAAS